MSGEGSCIAAAIDRVAPPTNPARVAELREIIEGLDQAAARIIDLGIIRRARNEIAALADAIEAGTAAANNYAAVSLMDEPVLPAPVLAGRCRICGCEEFSACRVGTHASGTSVFRSCGWADASHTLCDNPACTATVR